MFTLLFICVSNGCVYFRESDVLFIRLEGCSYYYCSGLIGICNSGIVVKSISFYIERKAVCSLNNPLNTW